jgi:uncharacterized protein (TIGR02996 family)
LTEQETLLWAIRADPYDNLARLAYADWCDDNYEHGRAELIRFQLDPEEGWRRQCTIIWTWGYDTAVWKYQAVPLDMQVAAKEVAVQMSKEELSPPWLTTQVHISRGFIEYVTYTLTQGYDIMQMFGRQPVLGVRLHGKEPARVGSARGFGWVRSLLPTPGNPDLEGTAVLPHHLFTEVAKLAGYPTSEEYPPITCCFSSTREALLALSCAVVKLGRRHHGLPPLVPAEPAAGEVTA